ncbi:hypothetical protein SAMN05443247_08719 [Bradyrhizobium erythrophlei]|nr:hypothetical protein SAMN05443247_08719 [Bradyrhizobium erythrophlei]
MTTRALVILAAVCFSATAFAQSPSPKSARKPPLAQATPKAPMGCKLVGTVKGTKIWAGDCADAAEIRGAEPTAESSPPAPGAIPAGQKQ